MSGPLNLWVVLFLFPIFFLSVLALYIYMSPSKLNSNEAEKMLKQMPLCCFHLSFSLLSAEKRPSPHLQTTTHIFLIIFYCQHFHDVLPASLSSATHPSLPVGRVNCYPSSSHCSSITLWPLQHLWLGEAVVEFALILVSKAGRCKRNRTEQKGIGS